MSQSEIDRIKDKLATSASGVSGAWPRFIQSIKVKNLHAFKDNLIEFRWPVSVIVGENGTGKSTILKLAACGYKSEDKKKTLYPSAFFPDTAWEKLRGVSISYKFKQGDKNDHIITKHKRWNGITERRINHVSYFGLGRTQPVETMVGFAKLAKKAIKETTSRTLDQTSTKTISEIIGKPYQGVRYARTTADTNKEIGVLKDSFGDVSEFHQGTGESLISDLVEVFEKVPDNSLLVIDEIESSLYPKAQRRLIDKILELTRLKMLQVIISTHSPYILSELPRESRILLTRSNDGVEVIYSPSVDFCLSKIDDELHAELEILVEDEASKTLISEMIRAYAPDINPRVKIIPTGPANVIKILSELSKKKKLPHNFLGIVDGDVEHMEPALSFPAKLAPEKQIIMDLSQGKEYQKLAASLNLLDTEVKKELTDVQTITDHRMWIDWLANRFNVSKVTLWDALCRLWIKSLTKEQIDSVLNPIKDKLTNIQ